MKSLKDRIELVADISFDKRVVDETASAIYKDLIELMPEKRYKYSDEQEKNYNFGYNQCLKDVQDIIRKYTLGEEE